MPKLPAPSGVIMQPTTLCNLDCVYCYLPLRKLNNQMPLAVAQAVADSVAQFPDTGRPLDIVWHGGEPSAVGVDYMRQLMAAFDGLPVAHGIQTNGTLIDSAWCDLFAEKQVRIGVSIDGRDVDNRQRVNIAGRPTWAQTMHGIGLLARAGLPYTTIAVVSDPDPEKAASLYDFFTTLQGCQGVGFNIEEQDGIHQLGPNAPTLERVTAWWAAIMRAHHANPAIRIRERDQAMNYAGGVLGGWQAGDSPRQQQDPLPTVAWDGSVTLFSPELAGFSADPYGSFACGNVLDRSLPDLIAATMDMPGRWEADFLRGISNCRDTCRYFDFCGGGCASNRWFEHGDLTTTETAFCRSGRMAVVDGLLTAARDLEGAQHADAR